MIVYRLAKKKYIHDLSGWGAGLYGGRWNLKGTGMIYTSESRALAVLEYLAHVPLALIPGDLRIASIEIPEEILPRKITASDLPSEWREHPLPHQLAELGSLWASSKDSLLLQVPSAIIEQEFNILINPSHPDIQRVAILNIEDHRLDTRLFRERRS